MTITAFDLRLGARAASVAALALAIAAIVVAATDEGGPWSARIGLLAAIGPAAGMIGAFAALRISEARGELRALDAIGVDPRRAARGVMASAIVGLAGPAIAATGEGDLSALFPRAAAARVWVRDGDAMREASLGVRVGPGGSIGIEAPLGAGGAAIGPSLGAIAAASLALAAIACPLWIVASDRARAPRRAAIACAAIVIAIGAFQAVAAGRAPPWALFAAPIALLADALALAGEGLSARADRANVRGR